MGFEPTTSCLGIKSPLIIFRGEHKVNVERQRSQGFIHLGIRNFKLTFVYQLVTVLCSQILGIFILELILGGRLLLGFREGSTPLTCTSRVISIIKGA